MKPTLQPSIIYLFLLIAIPASSQTIKLSNNSNLETAYPMGSFAILVSQNDSLWRTDGSPGGTFKYATNVSVSPNSGGVIIGTNLYFAGNDVVNGTELWVTDGTAPGTMLVANIEAAGSSDPTDIIALNGVLIFFANRTGEGVELWKSDGTPGGTSLLLDINPGPNSSFNNNANFFIHNNELYFSADNGTNGTELWKTNGTTAGTVMVKDINPFSSSTNFGVYTFYSFGTTLLLVANDGPNGAELWKTDGTGPGTQLVMDIAAGGFGSNPSQFITFNGKVYFIALDFTNGMELWTTDGTTANTQLVKDIDPGFDGSTPLLLNAVFMNSKFYFPATTVANGMEIWSSDGTAVGTTQFMDINPAGDAGPIFLLNFTGATSLDDARDNLYNGKIFFMADDGTTGSELWITDGTVPGTMQVKNINPASGVGSLENSTFYWYVGGELIVAADDGSFGIELWRSDGTNPNTVRMLDQNPNAGDADPSLVGILNNRVLFSADDADGGRDLFVLDLAVAPVYLLNFDAKMNNGQVYLGWTTTFESNTSHFEIERSLNGLNFEKIGTVKAAINSSVNTSYQFVDDKAPVSGRKLFYRLKMVDLDASFSRSRVAVVDLVPDSRMLIVYPSPATDRISVIVNSQDDGVLRISDQQGKLVFNRQLRGQRGSSQIEIQVSNYSPGVYYVQLITGGMVQTIKFVKN